MNLLMKAVAGTANNAPTIPPSEVPTSTTRITARGWIETADPIMRGCSMCPSICCTRRMMPSMMSAAARFFHRRATATANTPARRAPMKGMNAPRNVITPRGRTNGNPRARAPMVTPIPSQRATRSCAFVQAVRDTHAFVLAT